jgi:hypothetical protein
MITLEIDEDIIEDAIRYCGDTSYANHLACHVIEQYEKNQ